MVAIKRCRGWVAFLLFLPISELASACFFSLVMRVSHPRPPVPAHPCGARGALPGPGGCLRSCPSAACLWPTLLFLYLFESGLCPSAFLLWATQSSSSGALLHRSATGELRCGHGAAAELRERRPLREAVRFGLCFISFFCIFGPFICPIFFFPLSFVSSAFPPFFFNTSCSAPGDPPPHCTAAGVRLFMGLGVSYIRG